ncbi:Penicillin-binding protein 1F [Granulicatella adiacens]|jgi:penicillin-binding protein, 1A family|uniref:transglycosylase domain-containing protein n=1 Tax=Granulicatella TaxID=117563 RepID=UPI00069D1856|nr:MULTISPECIES: PBP1A family penicillin-binding protein [Granulicatella]OFT81172.1 penicillin-binding protein [Granulicatella sp. HMSC30F09]VTX81254.1 Penicillin-binding protein 1F [Granulicatella adiacens]
MNEEFNEKDHVDHVTHDQEQEETVEHRHTEEPTQPSIIKRVWNHKIMLAIRRFWRKFHVTKLILVLILTAITAFSAFLVYTAKTTDVSGLRAGMVQVTEVYDRNNQEAGVLNINKGEFVTIDQISPNMINALVSTEDKRFYDHHGFDPMGFLRATFGLLLNRGRVTGGGSTITQQLAKNAFLTQDQTFLRKAKELFLSFELEKKYSKDQILEMYLNNAYFGNGAYGIENASLRYFGKSAKDLTISEAAVLTGSLKAPNVYNPIDDMEATVKRRATVLQLMVTNGKITQEEADKAGAEVITVQDAYVANSRYKYPYYFDAVINEITNNYGISEEELLNKGYKIYTGLDQKMQADMEETFSNSWLFPKASDGTIAQAASVAMDPQNGDVLATVGGRTNEKHTFRGFNRATQLQAQPGSTFKPLAVYTSALEEGYQPNSVLVDEKRSYGSDKYTPENWNKQYQGTVTMTEALNQSWNAPAVWLLDKIGLKKGIEKVHQFGIETDPGDEYLGIALGGLTKGVSPIQMASAYTAFANKGVRTKPRFVTKIVDANGKVIVDNTAVKDNRVTTEEVAKKMTSMLLTVYGQEGLGAPFSPSGKIIAGKTGTTEALNNENGSRDQWMIGYTPDVVVATWMGYDQSGNYSLSASSREGVGPLFKLEMEGLLQYTANTAFNVEPVKTKQANQKNQNNTLDNFIQDAQKTGEQIWNQLQEWGRNIWNKFNNR